MKVKRFIAILLAVVLVLGLIPLTSVGGGVAYAAPEVPRVTTFSIANGTKIRDNSGNAVVGTVNGVEMFQKTAVLDQVMTEEWNAKFYDIGEIRIYYTADSEITSRAKIDGIQCEFAKNGYPNALLNDDYNYSSITYCFEEDYVVIGADNEYSAFFAYQLSLIQGSVDDADTTAPTLEVSGVTRTSASAATILFNADEGGEYFYSYGSLGDEITIDTANAGHTMVEGENTLELSGLTDGAKVLRILAKDAVGNMMEQSLEVVIPAYSTTAAEWPQLISFLLPDGKWSVSNGVKSVELTADNVRIEQYSQLLPYTGDDSANAYYAGMVVLDCKDTCITEPSEEAGTLRGWNGYAQLPAGFKNATVVKAGLSLYKGASELKITASKDNATYTYYYKVCIVGNDMLYSVPNTWTLNEAGNTFTFKPGKYLRSYAKWNTTNLVVPTWGTTSEKNCSISPLAAIRLP